ncbi:MULTISPECIES: nuclear transport factor 2 family protein [Thalassotalea]|uniref:nuclear transport factor 2 family protein n=1 Tax=Thalassotalea TaxID=1518149 RepID=UPI0009444F05|nr:MULTISPECIES: nuclear transport factor 2 family protein [Thalassotalea]OKY27189.1 hypothetical protein BI291_09680 [Thalassotalea sp. PP2-459]
MTNKQRVASTLLTDAEKQEIMNTTSSVVTKIFEASNNRQYLKGLDYYSNTSDAFFISGGSIKSLDELKASYEIAGAAVEDLHNDILDWNVNVLSADLVSFTLLVKLRLKLKGIKEYTGQIFWSAVLKKTDNQWLVVQSHESWLNAGEMSQALTIKE